MPPAVVSRTHLPAPGKELRVLRESRVELLQLLACDPTLGQVAGVGPLLLPLICRTR